MATIFHHAANSIIPMVSATRSHLLKCLIVLYLHITGGRSIGVSEFVMNMPESIS